MSGSSKEFSASDLDAARLIQIRNREVAKRIMAQGRAARPLDPESLAAHVEAVEAAKHVPSARVAAPPSPFAAVKSAAQLRREDEERIALLTRAVGVRPVNGPGAIVTEREKGEKPKREKRKADKAQAVKQTAKPEIPAAPTRPLTEAEREAKIQAYCDALRKGANVVEADEKLITYTYDLPGTNLRSSGQCKPSEFPPIAVKLAKEGSRRITPEDGVVLTMIHKREVTDPGTGKVTEAEFSVGRKYFDTETKAHEHGAKVLAEGLPRRKQCPECKGMGRVVDYRNTSRVCPECVAECNPNTCTADAKCKCRGEGIYGRGTVDAEPLNVHAYHVSRDVVRDGVRGVYHVTGDVERNKTCGVLALDRPLPGDPVVPSRRKGAICTGGKPSSGVWQSRAKTTKVTFSHG